MKIEKRNEIILRFSMLSIIFSLFLYSCANDNKTSSIKIISNRDTIALGETFRADLYFENFNRRLPAFRIIVKADTFNIPFEDSIKCATFQAVGRRRGNNTYAGNVEYYDKSDVFKTEDFAISFFVK